MTRAFFVGFAQLCVVSSSSTFEGLSIVSRIAVDLFSADHAHGRRCRAIVSDLRFELILAFVGFKLKEGDQSFVSGVIESSVRDVCS